MMELPKSGGFVFFPCTIVVIFVGVDEDTGFVECIFVESAIVVCAWSEVELALTAEDRFTEIFFCFTPEETDLIDLFSFYMNFNEILVINFSDIRSLIPHKAFLDI